MCGIAGIVASHHSFIFKEKIKNMTDVLTHRGPDGEGFYFSENRKVALGHRRLSVIDLSPAAAQPMKYLSRYTITYNGEIYNYLELKELLVRQGYKFYSMSDTEVLLAMYDWKKEKCLDSLDGMFAFAIYDEKEQVLFCARDRFGEKPFYYAFSEENAFLFGSEMKALFAGGISKKINNRMLYNYIAWNYVNNPLDLQETFYEGVFKLPAAHYLVIDQNLEATVTRYWNIDYQISNEKISFEDASESIKTILSESVSLRLRSDVAVGSCLSGGLDSSVIVNIINNFNTTKQKTFSARFKNYPKDEGRYIDTVTNTINSERHDVFIDKDSLIHHLHKIFYHQEEPFLSSSIVAQFEVMKSAKENGVKVLLDGQGSDELFGGYDYLMYAYFQELFLKDRKKYKGEWKKFSEINPFAIKRKTKFYLQALFPGIYPRFKRVKSFRESANASEINTEFRKEYAGHSFHTSIRSRPDFNYMLYESACGEAMEQILRYSDRNSMANSVEVRLPFLSHTLAEFVFSLPSDLKIREGWPKYILRKSFEGTLPNEITWRKDKIGFETPQKDWMCSNEMKSLIQDAKQLLVKEKVLNEKALATSHRDWNYLMGAKLMGLK